MGSVIGLNRVAIGSRGGPAIFLGGGRPLGLTACVCNRAAGGPLGDVGATILLPENLVTSLWPLRAIPLLVVVLMVVPKAAFLFAL